MKNVFLTNKLVKTLVIVVVFMVVAYFALPNYVSAVEINIGGVLIEPIKDLLLLIGDSAMLLINKVLYNIDSSLIEIDKEAEFLKAFMTVLGIGAGLALILTGVGSWTGAVILGAAIATIGATYMPDAFYLPYFTVSPQEIFANQIYFLDVNFFNPNEYDVSHLTATDAQGDANATYESTAAVLKNTVSSWYYTILVIAAVGLMCVLLYIAFKIIITSNTEEKAKYKERWKDWLIGMCLLATMHYIMVFSTSIVEAITKGLAENSLDVVILPIPKESLDTDDQELIFNLIGTTGSLGIKDSNGQEISADGGDVINYPTTLLGQARLEAQLGEEKNKYEDPDATGLAADSGQKVVDQNRAALHNFTYTIVYIILVFYTVSFLVIYIKRVMYMALLTMLAPLIAMYYPIDKITDGQAQGFNTWLQEYIFNLLMQPFHLIIYIMLVGSAMDLAVKNPIYAIVAIGFIIPAERLIRALFQLKKASNTTGESGSMIGTMMGLHLLQPFKGILGSGKKSSSGGSGSGTGGQDPSKVRTVDNGSSQGALAGGNGGNSSSGGTNSPSGPAIGNKKGALGTVVGKKALGAAKTIGKTAGRVAVAGAGLATGAVLGAAAGIASGKPGEAAKYAIAMGGIGAKAGTSAINGVKKLGDGAEKTFKGAKSEYQQLVYGTNNEKDIEYVKENADDYNRRYGNDARKWMQEGLALRREGLKDEEIHQAIELQRGGVEYYQKEVKENTVQDLDNIDDNGHISNKIEAQLINTGTKKKLQMNRRDSINHVKGSRETKAILEDPEKEAKLYQEMVKTYQNQGFGEDSSQKASEELAARRFVNGLKTD